MTGEAGTREARAVQRRQLGVVIALTGAILVVEVAGGIISGSLALLSDAGHMLTDLLALVLSLMAIRFASLPATPEKSYGYHRLEILTALVNGSFLVAISAAVLYQAFRRFAEPAPVQSGVMTGVAFVGLLINLAALRILSRSHQSLNIRGARMHIVGDTLSSLGVVATGAVIALTGWYRLDPIVGAVIAVVIVVGSVRLVREAVDVLLEATPSGIALDEVSAAIATVPGVIEVHDLHIWSITTGLPALSGHVRVEDGRNARSDETLNRIKQTMRDRFGIVHTTIQIESRGYQELGEVH
ncbi:MAG TPA: cation diffusion facilitator family transporter [Candidatus Polarisedimenticolia bacterium]|nr:cation diffusion facilitator family transporter [Candidatus Polarisedimenticolia bacterium]